MRPEIASALRNASTATGADFGYLVRTAARESSFDPAARAGTSSATGLFQFTEGTWLAMIERHGASHGVDPSQDRATLLSLRTDPELSARMAGELTRENASILESGIGRAPTSGELYVAHFLGPAGAVNLVTTARERGAQSASAIFPQAAAANPGVFRRDGADLSAGALYERLTGSPISDADSGRVGPADLDAPMAGGGITAGEASTIARLAGAQLASSLMSALFDLQTEAWSKPKGV